MRAIDLDNAFQIKAAQEFYLRSSEDGRRKLMNEGGQRSVELARIKKEKAQDEEL